MRILAFLLLVWLSTPLQGLPPAPFYTLYGTVRNELGEVIDSASARVVASKGSQDVGESGLNATLRPGQNYELRTRLDHARQSTRYYSDQAIATQGIFTLAVEIDGVRHLPLQITGALTAGRGGERVRLDLTVGVDSDNDGLPDTWEQWQLQVMGVPPDENGRWDLSLINPDEDPDGDGRSNLSEYFAGTYALDRESYLELRIAEKRPGYDKLEFFAISGRVYRLERSTNLETWAPVEFSTAEQANPTAVLRASASGMQPIYVRNPTGREFYRLWAQ